VMDPGLLMFKWFFIIVGFVFAMLMVGLVAQKIIETQCYG